MWKEEMENREILADLSFDGAQYLVRLPKVVAEKMETDKGDKIKFTVCEFGVRMEYVKRGDDSAEARLDKNEYRIFKFLSGRKKEVFTINEIRLWLGLDWYVAKEGVEKLRDAGYVVGYREKNKIYWGLNGEESRSEDAVMDELRVNEG